MTEGALQGAMAKPRKPLSRAATRRDKAEAQLQKKLRRAAAAATAAGPSGAVAHAPADTAVNGDARTSWDPDVRWQSWQGVHNTLNGAIGLVELYRDGFEGILLYSGKEERTLSIFELEARNLQSSGRSGAISWRGGTSMRAAILNRKRLIYAVHRRMVPSAAAAAPIVTLAALREAHSCELQDDPRLQDALQHVEDLREQHAKASGKPLSLYQLATTVLSKEDSSPQDYERQAFGWQMSES